MMIKRSASREIGTKVPRIHAPRTDTKRYRNIVFDMGRVLCDYSSRNAIEQFTSDEAVIREIQYIVYCSYEWALLDAGLMDEETVLAHTLHRLSSDAVREVARRSVDVWHVFNLRPKPGMDELIRALKKRGQKVYVLSNAGCRLLDCWRDVLPCPDEYDGILFSAADKCLKPQKFIYEIFFERFGLNPAECLFFDDLPWNVQGSIDCGMDAIVFDSGDVRELRKILQLD